MNVTNLKVMILGAVMMAISIPVFLILARNGEQSPSQGAWLLVTISAIANIVVILFHYTVPPHPKFLMVPWRKRVLLAHIISGSIELVAGLVACFGSGPAVPVAAVIMGLASLVHASSALAQTPIVFGSKAVMVPAYLLCIVMHAFCGVMLIADPTNLMWAIKTFLVFNIYVWCRVYYYAFDGLKLFGNQKYSVSILAAGATMIPALFGINGIMLLVIFVAVYIAFYRLLFIRSREDYNEFVRERGRDSIIDRDVANLWLGSDDGADERTAREFFNNLDGDHDGRLTRDELMLALSSWGFPNSISKSFAEKTFKDKVLDFEHFKAHVWSVGAVRQRTANLGGLNHLTSEREKAEFVFKQIDIDGDGMIGLLELELLLLEWGLPSSEAELYMKIADTDGDGKLSPDDFLKRMRPVWRYIYFDILTADASRKDTEMIGRSVSAFKDARKSDSLRHKVKTQLLSNVPFLEGATDELLSDLSTSLISQSLEDGVIVFAEGSRGDRFYLVGSGIARVSKGGEKISDLGPGACIGEGALLSDDPRAATVAASHSLTMYSLSRSSFEFLTEKYPKIREQLRVLHQARRVGDIARTIEHELIERVPFLQGASAELIADLAKSLVPEHFNAGSLIFAEGEFGDRFFLIQSGTVSFSKGGMAVAELGKGGCFGEGALLSSEVRWAATIATDECRLLSLSKQAFSTILDRYEGVKQSIFELHNKRLAQS